MSVIQSTNSMFQAVARREGFRQFVKFCIVGLSSTLIDYTIYLLLTEAINLQQVLGIPVEGARLAAQSISFGFAVTNGFIWNNKWTFRAGDVHGANRRYGKFILTNLVGLSLNLVILSAVAHLVSATMVEQLRLLAHLNDPAGLIGKTAATAIVVFWNFLASKFWTFKR
ncbi:MAG: GtrA family protein [Actinomycetota bacterium]